MRSGRGPETKLPEVVTWGRWCERRWEGLLWRIPILRLTFGNLWGSFGLLSLRVGRLASGVRKPLSVSQSAMRCGQVLTVTRVWSGHPC